MKKLYQIFVSSTKRDLIEERREVINTLIKLGHFPISMENFPATNAETAEWIRKAIKSSDYFILIVAGKYGSMLKDTEMSFTEMEYDYALELGIPRIGFLLSEDSLENEKYYDIRYCEKDEMMLQKLNSFRRKVESDRLCRKYSEVADLIGSISPSLDNLIIEYPRPGWVKSDSQTERTLQQEKDRLEKRLKDFNNYEKLKEFAKRSDFLKDENNSGGVEILSLIQKFPKLCPDEDKEIEISKRKKTEKRLGKKYKKIRRDGHAILDEEPKWSSDNIVFNYKLTDFVGVETLRGTKRKPVQVISTCVVLTCSAKKKIYLHCREKNSETYGGYWHTFGGAYLPPKHKNKQDGDGYHLVNTARRKLQEELGLTLKEEYIHEQKLLMKELSTGFIQLVLFADFPTEDIDKAKSQWNAGGFDEISFDRLFGELLSNSKKWVPTGKTHILAWLALGIPNLKEAQFGDYTAEDLFQKIYLEKFNKV